MTKKKINKTGVLAKRKCIKFIKKNFFKILNANKKTYNKLKFSDTPLKDKWDTLDKVNNTILTKALHPSMDQTRAFLIDLMYRAGNNMNVILVITGPVGSGKSTFSGVIGHIWTDFYNNFGYHTRKDKKKRKFTIKNITFSKKETNNCFKELLPGSFIQVDEDYVPKTGMGIISDIEQSKKLEKQIRGLNYSMAFLSPQIETGHVPTYIIKIEGKDTEHGWIRALIRTPEDDDGLKYQWRGHIKLPIHFWVKYLEEDYLAKKDKYMTKLKNQDQSNIEYYEDLAELIYYDLDGKCAKILQSKPDSQFKDTSILRESKSITQSVIRFFVEKIFGSEIKTNAAHKMIYDIIKTIKLKESMKRKTKTNKRKEKIKELKFEIKQYKAELKEMNKLNKKLKRKLKKKNK